MSGSISRRSGRGGRYAGDDTERLYLMALLLAN